MDEAVPSVLAVLSDGRGLAWGAVLRVDQDSSGALKRLNRTSVAVAEDRVYASWMDQRNGAATQDEVYVAVYDGTGFLPEQRIDLSALWPAADVREYRMAVDPGTAGDPSDDRIHLLMRIDPGLGIDELWMVSSLDGGATFGPLVPVTAVNGAADVDDIALAAEEGVLHVVWRDNRGNLADDDVWYQRSFDGGQSWAAVDTPLNVPGVDADDTLEVAAEGSLVAAVWQQDLPSGGPEELHANVSADGGTTWGGDTLLGLYTPGLHDVDVPNLAILGGRILVTWYDNRSGIDLNYLTSSTDAGLSWEPDLLLTTDTAGRVRIAGGGDSISLSWNHLPSLQVRGCSSRDGGATWSPSFEISTTSGDADDGEAAFNALYGNFIHVWVSDDTTVDHLYAGGFRPQTLAPAGPFSAGGSGAFQVSHWPAADSGASFGVLVSGGPGSLLLPFGDGRQTGLRNDAILTLALNNIPGLLSGVLDGLGEGSTPSFPIPGSAAGQDLHCVAVAFRTSGGVSLGAITDVVVVPVQ